MRGLTVYGGCWDMCREGGELAQNWHRMGGGFVAVWTGIYRGVRYREHETRKIGRGKGARPDRYFVIRYSVDGVMRQEGVGWESEGYSDTEAIHLLGQVRRNLREGGGPVSIAEMRQVERDRREAERVEAIRKLTGDAVPVFRDAARAWLEHAQESLRSWKTDEGRLRNHVLPLLGDVRLSEIDKGHVADFARALKRRQQVGRGESRLAAATIRQCVVLAGRIMEHARNIPVGPDRRVLHSGLNPFHGYKVRMGDNTRWRVATDDEVSAILGYCRERGGPLSEAYRLCVLIGVECGARLAEILNIRMEHLDASMGRVRLLDTKNDGSRFVYPPSALMSGILAQAERAREAGSLWLFPSLVVRNARLHKDSIGHFFNDACTALGINEGVDDRRGRVVFHTLRHTFGTRQIMAGTNLMTLKRLMGHRSISTTERYVHLAEEFVAESQR